MRSPYGPALAGVVLASVVVLSTLVASGSASSLLRPPPGSPDPKPMVLRSSDLGGVKAKSQHYFHDADFPSSISYEREFGSGRTGGTRLLYVDSQAEVGTSAQTTASFVAYIRRVFGSKQGRAILKQGFARGLGDADVLVSELAVGRPRNLGVGAGSFDLPMTVRILGLRTELHLAVFRVEQVLGDVFVVGSPGVRLPGSAMARLARIMAGRMAAQLGPTNVALPTISGVAQVGQTLIASQGAWTQNPSSFAYRWQRCDSSGANCRSISGASGQSYLPAGADAGFTIRVSVTARNSHGSATARSAPTGVVLASQAPANTALPTISGVAQAGQTLTGSTGSWTGAPTSFAFRWQRCDSAGATCVDVPGATAATYTLGGADVGWTVRVAVAASNAAGTTTAVSLPTAVVS